MYSRGKKDVSEACCRLGRQKRKFVRSKMFIDLRESTKSSLSQPIGKAIIPGGQLNVLWKKELPVRTTAEYERRRKSFHAHERTVAFMPSGKIQRSTTSHSSRSSGDSPEYLASSSLIPKIKRTVNNSSCVSKKLHCPHAPQNTSSYLMDQYNHRCKKYRHQVSDVEALSSCLEGIDTFGSFDRPTAAPVSG